VQLTIDRKITFISDLVLATYEAKVDST